MLNFCWYNKCVFACLNQVSKKARTRPQVQQGLDIKTLAKSRDGLSKVNTTTLIAYLRGEGVPCKVKDKKGELVAKVMAHLNLPMPQTNLQTDQFQGSSPIGE